MRALWIHKIGPVTLGASKTTYFPKWIIPAFIALTAPGAAQENNYDTRHAQVLLPGLSTVSITFVSHA
jgi:hypothetical protein